MNGDRKECEICNTARTSIDYTHWKTCQEYFCRNICYECHECETKNGCNWTSSNNQRYYERRNRLHKKWLLSARIEIDILKAEIEVLKVEHAKEIEEIYKLGGYGAKKAEEHFNESLEGL
jgi:hypothetical protein